jgi:3-oxosteroid 1-dehydrogenase
MPATGDEQTFDVVVVGSGAAGLTAAVTAALRGMSVVVIEKEPVFGGTTAFSGAVAWIPGNHIIEKLSMGWPLPKVGLADSAEKGKQYLMALVGPTVKEERIDAFLREGPRMLLELEQKIDLRWLHWTFPDYFSELPGGISYGRSIEPAIFDGHKLGAELKHLRPQSPAFGMKGLTMTGEEGIGMSYGMADRRGPWSAARVLGRRLKATATRARPLANGQSLLAQLRYAMLKHGTPLWLSTPMTGLETEGEGGAQRVTGVRVMRNGTEATIRVTRGVILASGGFGRSQQMRERFLPLPTQADWSLVPEEGQDGDGLTAAEEVGAALELTEKCWGFPTVVLPDRTGKMHPRMALFERMKPGVIVVNGVGKRYFSEGLTYEETWKKMYATNTPDAPTIPSWMIFETPAKRRYTFFGIPPRMPFPRWWRGKDLIHKADTIEELAESTKLPVDALRATVERFNELARAGHDDDFGRGTTAFARYFGDGRADHPNLGPLEKGPFYAVPIWPGDLSTKGGVLVDEDAQAIRDDGSKIEGLYACGNTSASVMGDTYPGGGGTVGPAMVLGYIAADKLADKAPAAEAAGSGNGTGLTASVPAGATAAPS